MNKVINLILLFPAYSLKLIAYSLILITLLLNGVSNSADVYDIGGSARAIGMGRAYNSQERASDSMFYNPAGLADMDYAEFTSMWGQLSGDITYTLFGGVLPTKWGVLGLGYANSSIGNLFTTTVEASGRVGSLMPFSYSENITLLSYANSIYREKAKDNISYGLRLKFYNKGTNDIAGIQGNGYSLDFGGAYEANERLRTSILLNNIIAGTIKWGKASDEAIEKGYKIGFKYALRDNLDVLGDLIGNSTMPIEYRLGCEVKSPKNNFSLRFGTELKPFESIQKYLNLALGAGLKFKRIGIDYAYYYDSLFPYNSRHFVSMSIEIPLFKTMRPAEKPKKIMQEKPAKKR